MTSYAGPNNEDQYSFGLSYVHVFNPNLLLNLKFGVFRSQILSFPANRDGRFDRAWFSLHHDSLRQLYKGESLVGSSGLTTRAFRVSMGRWYTTIGDTTFVPLVLGH